MLAACVQQAGEQAPPASPSETTAAAPEPTPKTTPAISPSPSLAPVATLEGEWRVAGIDGADFNEPYGLALSGSAQELWWEPRCARMARSYRIDGRAVDFAAALDAPKPGDPPALVCTIAPPPRLGEVMRALDAATTIGRTVQNGIEISGGGRSLLLFSQ